MHAGPGRDSSAGFRGRSTSAGGACRRHRPGSRRPRTRRTCAILASGLAFYTIRGYASSLRSTVFSAICMGSGISATHYLSMEAMRIPVTRTYSPGLVALSILVAIVLSGVALQHTFHLGGNSPSGEKRTWSGALLLGVAAQVRQGRR